MFPSMSVMSVFLLPDPVRILVCIVTLHYDRDDFQPTKCLLSFSGMMLQEGSRDGKRGLYKVRAGQRGDQNGLHSARNNIQVLATTTINERLSTVHSVIERLQEKYLESRLIIEYYDYLFSYFFICLYFSAQL